ncbi:hypothetical protein V4C53_35600 [Paraburkholderia azotifigens]|uniref:hypothetical protein n=1 Tax=Paraburkholderia azotifigens TaxID=2057004 RepID=UPI00317986E1
MLTAAEQKQIRDALCAIAVRGLRLPDELERVRKELTKEFLALKEVAAPRAAGAK